MTFHSNFKLLEGRQETEQELDWRGSAMLVS